MATAYYAKHHIPLPNGAPINAGYVVNFCNRAAFLKILLYAALKTDDPDLELDQVDSIYQAYIDKTGDKADLEAVLVEEFVRTTNPRKAATNPEVTKDGTPDPEISGSS